MKESEFHRLADAQFQAIEQAVEECGVDIDFDTSGGVLTLTFENKSKIIIINKEQEQDQRTTTKEQRIRKEQNASNHLVECEIERALRLSAQTNIASIWLC